MSDPSRYDGRTPEPPYPTEPELAEADAEIADLRQQLAAEQAESAKLIERWMALDAKANAELAAERKRREKAEAERETLEETLWFYADPGTYFAIAFFPDPPCGEFMDDFEEPNPELEMWDGIPSPKPGKRARASLSAPAQPDKEATE